MKSVLVVSPGHFSKTLNIPTSKSYANRLLILASLYPQDIHLKNITLAQDVIELIKALSLIGITLEQQPHENFVDIIVKGSFPQCEEKLPVSSVEIPTGDG